MRIGLLACAMALSLAACGGSEQATLPPLGDVETFDVAATSGAPGRGWDGVVEAVRRSDLSAQTAGRVTAVEVDVNDRVAAGAVLLRISAVEQDAGANAARAQLRAAEASTAEAEQNGPFPDDLKAHYLLEGPDPDYRPDPSRSLPAIAAARGVSMAEAYLDIMVASGGTAYFNHPLLNPEFEAVEEMLSDPLVVLGLAQTTVQYVFFYVGLAHTTGVKGSIMNATGTFFSVLLAHWVYHNDRLSHAKLWGCVVGFAGVMVVNLGRGTLDMDFTLLGEGFVVIAAFVLAALLMGLALLAFSLIEGPAPKHNERHA